tara:strand:+ start:2009 stop:2596 length:588 start_codon:yes stop_codon:yes gene_type:complete
MAKNLFKQATEILTECNFVKLTEKTTDHPFFMPHSEHKTIQDLLDHPRKDNTTIIDIADKILLPELLYRIYLLLDVNEREFSYNTFTFMSINEIAQRFRSFQDTKQKNICDFAISYYGLGHIMVLSWNIATKSFILRRDGGSNDYDRRENSEFIVNYDATQTPPEKQIHMSDLFNTLKNNNFDDFRNILINNYIN